MVEVVLMPKLTIGMVVQTRKNNRTTGTAGSSCAVCPVKANSLQRKGIQVGRLHRLISIAAQVTIAMVIRHNQYNIGQISFLVSFPGLLLLAPGKTKSRITSKAFQCTIFAIQYLILFTIALLFYLHCTEH